MQACDSALDLPAGEEQVSGRERERGREEKQNTWQLTVQIVCVDGGVGREERGNCWPLPGKRYLIRGKTRLSDWLQVCMCSVLEKNREGSLFKAEMWELQRQQGKAALHWKKRVGGKREGLGKNVKLDLSLSFTLSIFSYLDLHTFFSLLTWDRSRKLALAWQKKRAERFDIIWSH